MNYVFLKMDNKVLLVKDLSIGFKSKKQNLVIANSINFNINQSEVVALIGKNGIGKSTLLRSIIQFENPISGNIEILDKNIKELNSLELAKKISVVLTDKLPPSNLSVYELVALGRQPYTNWVGELSEIDKSEIQKALKLTKTEHLSDKKHHQLSDGQLQKVMIARALAQDTPIIILDEPTSHLDLVHKISVFKLLKELAKTTNKTILFSTHDIDLAIDFCDKIIAMMSNKTIIDSPNNLINLGVLNQIFEDDSVVFDSEKKKFIYNL